MTTSIYSFNIKLFPNWYSCLLHNHWQLMFKLARTVTFALGHVKNRKRCFYGLFSRLIKAGHSNKWTVYLTIFSGPFSPRRPFLAVEFLALSTLNMKLNLILFYINHSKISSITWFCFLLIFCYKVFHHCFPAPVLSCAHTLSSTDVSHHY